MIAARYLPRIIRGMYSRGFVTIHFHTPDKKTHSVEANPGEMLLRVAQHNNIPLEGACECGMACATCHVVIDKKHYDALPEPTEEEEDCLDNASGLTETSRLGCQIKITEDMDGMEVTIPNISRNFYVDGHVPKPHSIV